MIKKNYNEVEELEVKDYGSTGTTIRWLITKEKENAPRFSLRRFEIQPGGQIGIHNHPQEHEIYILSGKGEVFTQWEYYTRVYCSKWIKTHGGCPGNQYC